MLIDVSPLMDLSIAKARAEFERAYIDALLDRYETIAKVAAHAKMDRSALQRKMRQLGMPTLTQRKLDKQCQKIAITPSHSTPSRA